MSRPSAIRASHSHRAGLLLALVALAVQVAAASIVLPITARIESVDRLMAASLCHPGKTPVNHPPLACAACPLCHAVAQAGVLLAPPAAALAAPAAVAGRFLFPPPTRTPPRLFFASAYPRGPPV